jgi:hypothetical protein
MATRTMTLEEIRLTGLEALAKALGPVGFVRFLQQFETGSGDYTAQREKLLGRRSVQELSPELEKLRQAKQPK